MASAPPNRPIPVLIVAYKNPRQLDLCHDALAKQDVPVEARVHDNSIENIYYTPAANRLLRPVLMEGHEFVILINQDCYLRPDAARQMVRFMREHPRCAIAGIRQRSASDLDFVYHAGCTVAWPGGQHLSGSFAAGVGHTSGKMPWVNGSAIIARTSAVMEIGLLDENLLMCGCDSDWCYTARTRGWEVWYCAEAECLHEVGVSFAPRPPALEAVFQRDLKYWYQKWMTVPIARLEPEFPHHVNAGLFRLPNAPPR